MSFLVCNMILFLHCYQLCFVSRFGGFLPGCEVEIYFGNLSSFCLVNVLSSLPSFMGGFGDDLLALEVVLCLEHFELCIFRLQVRPNHSILQMVLV